MIELIDSHCHLDAAEFEADRAATLERAANAGVRDVVLPGTDLESSHKAAALCDLGALPRRYASVGVHPHTATQVTANPTEARAQLRHLASTPGVIAIGETGLDYHYSMSPHDDQRASLRLHVQLARELELPLILHCREAEQDLLDILREEDAARVGGVVHCFTGTATTAHALIELGFHLGFTGIITFRNAQSLRDLIPSLPRERILMETDSPYLAPIPHRGKRNEPAYVLQVAETLGHLLGCSTAEAAQLANDNVRRLFRLQA